MGYISQKSINRLVLFIEQAIHFCQTKFNLSIGLSYKTITYDLYASLIHNFDTIYLYILYALKILSRLLMRKYIRKKRNTTFVEV